MEIEQETPLNVVFFNHWGFIKVYNMIKVETFGIKCMFDTTVQRCIVQ